MNRLKSALLSALARPGGWLWMASLFLVGLGARLWLIHRFGSPLPMWDEWTEETLVYIPYLQGRLSLAELFAPHSEHRMLFAWLYNLAIFLLNDQWDSQLKMVVNALVYSAGITGFGWILARLIGRRYWPLIAMVFMLSLALPFAWENTLAGDQAMVYLTILMALLTLWLLGGHEPRTSQWSCGVLVALACLCLPTSGVVTAAAICGLLALKFIRQPQVWKRYWPTLAVCLVVILLGLALRGKPTQAGILMAHSVSGFLVSLGQYLAWPWIVLPPFAVFNLFPIFLLAWVYLRNRRVPMPAEEMVLVLSFWAVLHSAASAYARGALPYPQWRYMDVTCFVMIANGLSLGLLVSRHLGNSRWRTWWYVGFILWGGACAGGLVLLNLRAWQIDIPERQFYQRAHLKFTRAFMATDDVRVFEKKPKPQLPMMEGDPHAAPEPHQGQTLAKELRNPIVQQILPACIRPSLDVRANVGATYGFVTNGFQLARPEPPTEVSWGSCTTQGPAARKSFESLPIQRSRLPYLEIPVTGDLGEQSLSLELVDLTTGQRIPVKPSRTPGNQWLNCYVRAPAGEFKLVAEDNSGTGWFAFKAPRELGRLSFWAIQLLRLGKYLLFAGLALLLFNLVTLCAHTWRRDHPPLPATPGKPSPQ